MDTMETTESPVYDQTDVIHTPINTPSKLKPVKENIIDDLIDIAEGLQSNNFLLSNSFKKVVERIGTECGTKIKELSDKVDALERGPTLPITSNQHNQLSWVDALTKPKDEERRSRNIVVFGIPQSTKDNGRERYLDDKKLIEDLFTKSG
ncbi:unnamed protein product [Brachionus calyciflorus]|uniref:Uncharacterized protein n=1 Tax=Brachionus calyciflorus TaxID=104777 RepID=A0A813M2W3_9BILA|nr:unnamed protein product [Brachionus calyciflorus]